MRRIVRAALWLGIAGLAPAAAPAQGLAVNDTIAAIALEDQHGAAGGVEAGTRGVLLSRDMEGGGLVREALATDGAAQLERAGAVYIADVHAMPALIRRFVALPRMRERPYRVLLDTDGAPSAAGLRVVEIRFLTSAREVGEALAVPAGN